MQKDLSLCQRDTTKTNQQKATAANQNQNHTEQKGNNKPSTKIGDQLVSSATSVLEKGDTAIWLED